MALFRIGAGPDILGEFGEGGDALQEPYGEFEEPGHALLVRPAPAALGFTRGATVWASWLPRDAVVITE